MIRKYNSSDKKRLTEILKGKDIDNVGFDKHLVIEGYKFYLMEDNNGRTGEY